MSLFGGLLGLFGPSKLWLVLVVLAIVGLAVAAFFVSRALKYVICLVALIMLSVLGQRVYHAGYQARVTEDVAEQTRVLQERIRTMEEANAADNERASNDAKVILELEKRANEIPVNVGRAFDRDAVRRLRGAR